MDELVGARAHALMWGQKITQTALAPAFGITQSALAKKLRGKNGWSLADLSILAEKLETTIAYLVGETDDPNRPGPRGGNSGLLVGPESPLSDSNRRPPLYKSGALAN